MSDARPLVLLDVDGVLNLAQFLSSGQRGRLYRRDGWFQGRAGDPHDPYASRIVLSRRLGPLLRSLEDEGAELAWATGWEGEANTWISPLLGLGELAWAPAVHGCKAGTVIPWTGGRPWCWFEDHAEELDWASRLSRGVPHLPVLVDRATGLTGDHVELARKWLREL